MNKLFTIIVCLTLCIITTQAQNESKMLSKKQQQVAAISMYTSQGDQENLKAGRWADGK